MSTSWIGRAAVWVLPVLGGDSGVRQWHHALMWFFPAFILVHVYLVAYHDYVEGRGVMSSMVGGWKFIDRPSRTAAQPSGTGKR